MNQQWVQRQFERIGARLRVSEDSRRIGARDYAIDITNDHRGELFELLLRNGADSVPEIAVLQSVPVDRHLLVLVNGKDRFLCGHDERHWFVAAVPKAASTVALAKEALKPLEVSQAQVRLGLSLAEGSRRKNKAFIRQGEWFFVPAPDLVVDSRLILGREPIRRGQGKPHMVDEVYRTGGTTVYVCREYPEGLTARQRQRLIRSDPKKASRLKWQTMVRDAHVYGRGAVRHPDHKTVRLRGWHRILMNMETNAGSMSRMVFLD